MSILIKEIPTEQTYPIRHQELRQGFPIETCHFDEDDDSNTFHLGAFENGNLVGVVTLVKSEKGYQLRGMAVLSSEQGKGIGALLMQKAEEKLHEKQVNYLWMNARVKAIPFYKKLGYSTKGDSFTIKTVGEHIVMEKKL
ncbi:GNAT family N-acetyltransferase [Weeksellaceae bacterium TAE3-ERU29]|nr:GNAT family N-acetyltransferase [Weeksellaceae bacterium TAE3-ERU29]